MAKNLTLKGRRTKPWQLVKFRPPQKAHLGNEGFSIIPKMCGEKRFRYLTAGDKNGKILLITKK
jgi:hypothetical protein